MPKLWSVPDRLLAEYNLNPPETEYATSLFFFVSRVDSNVDWDPCISSRVPWLLLSSLEWLYYYYLLFPSCPSDKLNKLFIL